MHDLFALSEVSNLGTLAVFVSKYLSLIGKKKVFHSMVCISFFPLTPPNFY